jgi:hypothetical protein
MPRGPATFKQSDVMRVIKAARAAGLDVIASTILPDGSLLLVHALPGSPTPSAVPERSSWDDALGT